MTVGRDREQVAFESELFAELRPLMFSIAYRMLGSVSEADDVVQEASLRFHQALMRETSTFVPDQCQRRAGDRATDVKRQLRDLDDAV